MLPCRFPGLTDPAIDPTETFAGCRMFWTALEVEANFSGQRSRRDVVGSAKGGEEIVECHFIGDVDDREASAPTVAVAMEEIVVADGKIEQVAWGNARRIVVIVFGARRRDR